jgi:hypothetical protein
MRPALFTVRDRGASLSKAKCVRVHCSSERKISECGADAKARAHLEHLADFYATPAREAELIAIFNEATRLEADFWEMGWRTGQRVE